MRRLLTLAVLVSFVAVLALPSIVAPAEGPATSWEIALRIDSASSGAQKPFEAFDTSSLVLFDFDGDGIMEIVSNNDNNRAYVISVRTGRVLTEIATTHPSGERWNVRDLNPISIGDVYGDGVPCMVIPSSAAYMAVWCFNAEASTPDSFNFTKKWEVRLDAAKYEPDFKEKHPWLYDEDGKLDSHPGADGHAYLADVDGDGTQEIFAETDGYPGQLAFNHDGTYRWSKSFADGNGGAKVVDIDDDGKKEAVFVSDAGLVVSYSGSSGSIEWVFDSRKHGSWPGSIPVSPLVADLHGDGKYEIIFGTRNVTRDQSDPNWINESHARYFALDHAGRVLWSVSYDWMNPLQYNHPAAADVNGDGVLDVVFLDWNTVGHKPGDWDTTNRPANLFALDGRDGSPLWHRGITVYWSNKDFVIADADGDGDQDVIAPTAKGGSDGLGIYSLRTGEPIGWFPLEWQLSRGPVAGDVYGDGKLSIVAPLVRSRDDPNYRNLDVGYRHGALVVIRTNVAYDVTFSANILNSDSHGEPQPVGDGGTPPPPPSTPTPPPPVTPEPTPSEDVEPPVATTPAPTPTPTASPTPTAAPSPTPIATSPSPSPSPSATPSATPSPSPTPTVDEVTGDNGVPGVPLALVAAAVAAAAVLWRRKRA